MLIHDCANWPRGRWRRFFWPPPDWIGWKRLNGCGSGWSPKDFCPAAGQGSLGIETRKDDAATIAAVAFLDDADTRFAVTVERAALGALGGGCQVPIGIHCRSVAPDCGLAEPRLGRNAGRGFRRCRRFDDGRDGAHLSSRRAEPNRTGKAWGFDSSDAAGGGGGTAA